MIARRQNTPFKKMFIQNVLECRQCSKKLFESFFFFRNVLELRFYIIKTISIFFTIIFYMNLKKGAYHLIV